MPPQQRLNEAAMPSRYADCAQPQQPSMTTARATRMEARRRTSRTLRIGRTPRAGFLEPRPIARRGPTLAHRERRRAVRFDRDGARAAVVDRAARADA